MGQVVERLKAMLEGNIIFFVFHAFCKIYDKSKFLRPRAALICNAKPQSVMPTQTLRHKNAPHNPLCQQTASNLCCCSLNRSNVHLRHIVFPGKEQSKFPNVH
ncbi:hypothetical protein RRG08_037934 [Elysia crispata]|uniref:Uncharacterized protein n=1 Tax=Elysia crispata TaxID=231223 RepID=A0AAE1D9B4_9GAST|nr:hypothetical protein RRG08_037934 [Elysia crispata]